MYFEGHKFLCKVIFLIIFVIFGKQILENDVTFHVRIQHGCPGDGQGLSRTLLNCSLLRVVYFYS